MGKQIRFYMDEDTESAFVEYVMKEDGKILYEGNNAEPVVISNLPEPFQDKGWFSLYLYKPAYGALTLQQLPSGVKYIDTTRSPVIEFSRTVVRDNPKEVGHGRLWLEMRYWDCEDNLVEKPKELDTWYAGLSRWIRKNVPRIEHFKQGYSYKDYVSPKIQELMEKGYQLM